jgi:O-antigen ligase
MVGFGAGTLYLVFLLRKNLGAPVLVGVVGLGTLVLGLLDQLLSRSGRTLSVFYRFANTRFYGVLPETRVGVFKHIKLRIAEHPILGEGPFYRLRHADPDVVVFWPHNAFAYYWATVGLLGLLGFILTMWQVLRKTWQERAQGLGEGYTRELLLVLHVMMVVFVVTQQRTDFQRGFVFTYYVFFLLGFSLGVWRLARDRRLAREAREGVSPGTGAG